MAKEQEQTNYNFIYLCGGDLRLPNHVVFLAHKVFRHVGIDVINTVGDYLKNKMVK